MRRFLKNGAAMVAPNFKDGEKFFLVIDNKIVAACLHKSFYNTTRLDAIRGGDAVLWGLVETSVPVGVRFQDKYMRLHVKGGVVWLCDTFTDKEFPVFNSIEDARKNRQSTRVIDLCKEGFCNEGIGEAWIVRDVNAIPLIYYVRWELGKDGKVQAVYSRTQTLVWGKDGLYLSDWEKALTGGYATRELAEKARDKARANMEVCDFPDDEKGKTDGEESEEDSPVLAVMGMISGVLDLIAKELEKYEEER